MSESESASCSIVSDSATPWSVAHQVSLYMEFSRQEYWRGLPFPSSGDLPRPGIEPRSPSLEVNSLPSEPQGKPHYLLLSHFSRVRLCATPQTTAHQAPPSLGFSRQEHWSGLPLPSPGDLPNPGIEPGSPALQADALPSEPQGKPHMHT